MRRAGLFLLALITLIAVTVISRDEPRPYPFPAPRATAITTYHGDVHRSGLFIVPGLTWKRAKGLRLDTAFHAQFAGHVHAQPLYWKAPGSRQALLIVATEENIVYALDAVSGRTVWKRKLGTPVAHAALTC